MGSEYEPVFGGGGSEESARDLAEVRAAFRRASRAYLSSPLPWLAWAVVLPAAALLTPRAAAAGREAGVLLLWCGAILAGGAVEGGVLLAARRRLGGSRLGSWAMTIQGNLSLVGAALSLALVLARQPRLLPALWLLLLGHSLFVLGGLALPALRAAGVVYQLGGVLALVPGAPVLPVFAAATALGNVWVAIGVARRPREAAGLS